MITIISVIEAFFIVVSLSIDAMVSSFAYGANKIKIPFGSAMVINVICTIFLTVSLYIGNLLSPYLSPSLTRIISFSILFILGLIKLFDSMIKALIKRREKFNKEIQFKIFSLSFILNVYASPEKADKDASSTLSVSEAIYLAVALSLDGLAVGFGAGVTTLSPLLIIGVSLLSDLVAIYGGYWLGSHIAHKTSLDLSWLSGVLLIILAVTKLI